MRKLKGRTKVRGYISDKTLGINIHSCLAVTVDGLARRSVFFILASVKDRTPGMLDQLSYNRSQAKDSARSHESKKTRSFEEKESYRWVKTLEGSTSSLPEDVKVITVCDREGDMAD